MIPVDPVRRRIAAKMVQSKHEAPHAWTMMQVDVTKLVKLREQVGPEFRAKTGRTLSYMPFFIKAVVESLREYPILNSTWEGDRIVIKQDIHISIAVATEDALAVPVIKHADRLSIAGLNHAVADLAERARAGKLTLDDVTGGTFTVNNTGAFGSFMSAPIINYPQAAILSFEAITKMPVVLENDAIAIRSMMNICLSLGSPHPGRAGLRQVPAGGEAPAGVVRPRNGAAVLGEGGRTRGPTRVLPFGLPPGPNGAGNQIHLEKLIIRGRNCSAQQRAGLQRPVTGAAARKGRPDRQFRMKGMVI